MANRANVAATFMEHLCECEAHGYSWSERYGNSALGTCTVECEGVTGEFFKGDRDCSSAIIDAWSEALKGTKYEGVLAGASYTGNMKEVFLASGIFEWRGMDYCAHRGDIYLNEQNHTAMCTSIVPDMLAEFCINENGECYGGESGDQTGTESRIAGYYDFPWDGMLVYNGGADDGSAQLPDTPQPTGGTRYRVQTRESGWLDWMEGLIDTGGSGDDYAGEIGNLIYGFECEHDFELTLKGGQVLPRNDNNENGELPVIGITIFADVRYTVHTVNGNWLKVEHGADDNGAGDDVHVLDMVRILS